MKGVRNSKVRRERKRLSLIADVRQVVDDLQHTHRSIEARVATLAEALIFLIEGK